MSAKGFFVQVSTKLWSDDDHECSLAAWGLWIKLLSSCGDGMTDGAVSLKQYQRVIVGEDPEECLLLMKSMVDQRLLKESKSGWVIVNYSDWNETKKDIMERRAAAAERASKSRRNRASKPELGPFRDV